MGRDLPVEEYWVSLELVKSATGQRTKESSLFDGLPVTFADWDRSEGSGTEAAAGQTAAATGTNPKAYPDRRAVTRQVQTALKQVRQVAAAVTDSRLNPEEKTDLHHRLQVKEEQLLRAGAEASDIRLNLTVDPPC